MEDTQIFAGRSDIIDIRLTILCCYLKQKKILDWCPANFFKKIHSMFVWKLAEKGRDRLPIFVIITNWSIASFLDCVKILMKEIITTSVWI